MPQNTLELGKLLVREIRDQGNEDTLTVWLMHYIAELIKKAERDGTSTSAQEVKKEACETILKLWEHRASLAGRANPMKEYEGALRMLKALSNQGYFVFGVLDTDGDPVEQFRQGAATLLSSLFTLMLPSSAGGNDIATRHLSKTERELIRNLHVIRIRRLVSKGEGRTEGDPQEIVKRDIREDVARLRKTLDAIDTMLS